MKKLALLLAIALIVSGCVPTEAPPKASQTSPPSVNEPIPTPTPTISVEEAEMVINSCEVAAETGLSDGTVLRLCQTKNALDVALLGLVPATVISVATPLPGDELVVGGILVGTKVIQLVVITALVTAPMWVPLVDVIGAEVLALVSADANTAAEEIAETHTDTQTNDPSRNLVYIVTGASTPVAGGAPILIGKAVATSLSSSAAQAITNYLPGFGGALQVKFFPTCNAALLNRAALPRVRVVAIGDDVGIGTTGLSWQQCAAAFRVESGARVIRLGISGPRDISGGVRWSHWNQPSLPLWASILLP